jgi:hypothetical protein
VRLSPLYRATFTTPEAWSITIPEPSGHQQPGARQQGFLIAEGRAGGGINARLRGANYTQRRTDDVFEPDFRGVLETDDGATILFAWHGYASHSTGGVRALVGSITHLSDDPRYRRLNDTVAVLTGEVRPRPNGHGAEVTFDVAELVWEAS